MKIAIEGKPLKIMFYSLIIFSHNLSKENQRVKNYVMKLQLCSLY